MRLSAIEIENFRSIKHQKIVLGDYACFVGPNGVGKSSILNALNFFFKHSIGSTNIDIDDFHRKKTTKPIRVTLEFNDLTPAEQETFKHYFRQSKLLISAVAEWKKDRNTAEIKQVGTRYVMSDFRRFFEVEKAKSKVADLKTIYMDLKKSYSDLPDVSTRSLMLESLRTYEEEHPELCSPIESEDEFYGISKGRYLLEAYIKWIFIPAVKDASTEQEEGRTTVLKELLDYTIRDAVDFKSPLDVLFQETVKKYDGILEEKRESLDALEISLKERLREWYHRGAELDVSWHRDPDKSVKLETPIARIKVGEDDFTSEVFRMGHGLQRLFLVVLLEELVKTARRQADPMLLLGWEEPELYQHPPQARHIAKVLEDLGSSQRRGQVLITTHCPYFISSRGFENIHRVRKDTTSGSTSVLHATLDDLSNHIAACVGDNPSSPGALVAKIDQIMRPVQNELYFAGVAILVEGAEDVAYLSSHIVLSGKEGLFRELGCHFIPCEGKTNMSRPKAIADKLGIPAFLVFDGDSHLTDEHNKKDNRCLQRLCGVPQDEVVEIPSKDVFHRNFVMWHKSIADTVRNQFGLEKWNNIQDSIRKENNLLGIDYKNPLLIAATLEKIKREGWYSDNLEKACSNLMDFARKEHKHTQHRN